MNFCRIFNEMVSDNNKTNMEKKSNKSNKDNLLLEDSTDNSGNPKVTTIITITLGFPIDILDED